MKWITALLSKSTPISMTISKPQNPRFGNGSRACLGTRLRLQPRSQKIWKLFFFLLKFNMVCMFWIVLMCWCQKWFLKNEKTSLACILTRKVIWKAPATTLSNTLLMWIHTGVDGGGFNLGSLSFNQYEVISQCTCAWKYKNSTPC
jgi:hypothetical protein